MSQEAYDDQSECGCCMVGEVDAPEVAKTRIGVLPTEVPVKVSRSSCTTQPLRVTEFV